MTHVRYWAMTFAVAISGAFLAIERLRLLPPLRMDRIRGGGRRARLVRGRGPRCAPAR